MTSDMTDDDLLSHLAAVFADDQPPSDAMEAAYAAFGWRTLDADLAQLLDDSQAEVVLFRQGTYARRMTYDCAHGTIELGVDDHSYELVVRPSASSVVVHRPWGSSPLMVDEQGRAHADGEPGPIRFGIVWAGGTILTPWTTL